MGQGQIMGRLRRLATKSPAYIVRRLAQEARMESERVLGPAFARSISGKRLARWGGHDNVDALWLDLAARPYPAHVQGFDRADYDKTFPGSSAQILAAADRAMAHQIDLLGTGPVHLGEDIDWLKDFKTGDRWPVAFCRSIDYVNKGRPSDVKVPWEISRLQWLLPVGQAYVLTGGDERYAQSVRAVIESWIAANPYGYSVNWSCTMEPALRLQTWTWLFHIFAKSKAWADVGFRDRFLSSLYLHGAFTEIHIERASINGNHLTADAAGLVFAGLFFRGIGSADRWAAEGWRTLNEEIVKQVHPDGVDFEASVPYHRLVAELFVMPARYRKAGGLVVEATYRDRLEAMGRFVAAYSRPDGTSPHWGDADDGRGLPLGTQSLGDHRYLCALIGDTLDDTLLIDLAPPKSDEIAWHGARQSSSGQIPLTSQSFRDGGVYILAGGNNHVFVDCGPVGLAGLGGHGHNDALSFEAWLDGQLLVADPGSYVYTADFDARNRFRSTASHNTPQVDGAEINRLHASDNLWNLHEDAKAEAVDFSFDGNSAKFVGQHFGYTRLADPVTVQRTLAIDFANARLSILDEIKCGQEHELLIPLYLAAGVEAKQFDDGYELTTAGRRFVVNATGVGWQSSIQDAFLSPSYGVTVPSKRIVWAKRAIGVEQLSLILSPVH
ncbi:hypothetical protein JP75_20915 [Devosia riboflavina]|uniref:Uncharacterized protein n=1 Tax=Devosia riboflavina TaxID=46914 RepID=A0A087LXR7_9HYPH|nr:hypothetical protein JP75_20915 [Devosia riboflavina]